MNIKYIIAVVLASLLAGCVIRDTKRNIEEEHRKDDIMRF